MQEWRAALPYLTLKTDHGYSFQGGYPCCSWFAIIYRPKSQGQIGVASVLDYTESSFKFWEFHRN